MNDLSNNDLERAREAVDALAPHVDTAAAWTALEAALDRRPRDRARRGLQLAAASVSVVVMVGAVVYTLHSRSGRPTLKVTNPGPQPTSPSDCALPSLPAPGSQTPGSDPSAAHLRGPAVTALQGGAARSSFELNGGQLTVAPPRPGDTPAVSATQAECMALATNSPNGWSLLQLASQYGGAAVGYGRVSVAPALVASARKASALEGQTNQNTHPTLPDAAPYQDRLAWLVVVREVEIYHGPPGATTPPFTGNGYVVFVVDAQTGSDALVYAEGQQPGSSGSVIVPAERVSVPWTLVSRSSDGYAGKISITVLPCDGYPNPLNVDSDRAAVAVVVERPVGAPCGERKQVIVALHAATVTSNLPAVIAHDPLGPVVTLPSPNTPKPPGDTGGVLRLVTEADKGKTIRMTVGSVLGIGPLHVLGHYAADPVASSDPTVLGPLDDSVPNEVSELRAWHTGRADLSIPGSDWIVHIEVE